MITLTLARGEDENSLAASGTHYRAGFHKTFTLTGKFGIAEEDGKIPVELKFVYIAIWLDTELTGKFDPEEESLRGTLRSRFDVITGDFVFKRNPDFVRFYPSPSTITARKRWEFAITAVLDRIRRDSWSPMCILQRIRDGKRYMEFSIRDGHYGRRLNTDEEKEYYALFSTLFAEDARFYASLIMIKLADVPIQYVHNEPCALAHSQVHPIQPDRVRRLQKHFGGREGPLYGLSRPGYHRRLLFRARMSQIHGHDHGLPEGSDRAAYPTPQHAQGPPSPLQ